MKVTSGYERDVDRARNTPLDVSGSAVGFGDSARDAALADERARAAQRLRLAIGRAEDGRNRDAGRTEARKERLLAMIEPVATQWRERDAEQAARRDEGRESETGEQGKDDGEGRADRDAGPAGETHAHAALPEPALLLPPPERAPRDGEGRSGGNSAAQPDDRGLENEMAQFVAARLAPPMSFGAAAFAPPAPGSTHSDRDAKIDRIVDRVETAWRSHFALRPNETIQLNLKMETAGPGGFDGLTVAISASVLDVTLLGAGAPTAALIEAAQALAQRLHRRFPDRVVRVIGAAEAEPATDGLGALSQILGGSGARG